MEIIFNQSTLDLIKNTEIHERSALFMSNTTALELFVHLGYIKTGEKCKKCGTFLNLQKKTRSTNSIILRCTKRSCKSAYSLLYHTSFGSLSIRLNDMLYIIYKFIKGCALFDILSEVKYSKPTIINFIKLIQKRIKPNSIENSMIGGNEIVLQIDETAVSRKGKIYSPTSSSEETNKKTKWLLGIINENDPLDFKLILLKNRTIEHLTEVFKKNIVPGTVIKTDGYPSYPAAANAIKGEHIVVNHSDGFKNKDGCHTNQVENLWSCLKSDINKRHGVIYLNLDFFFLSGNGKEKILSKRIRKGSLMLFG